MGKSPAHAFGWFFALPGEVLVSAGATWPRILRRILPMDFFDVWSLEMLNKTDVSRSLFFLDEKTTIWVVLFFLSRIMINSYYSGLIRSHFGLKHFPLTQRTVQLLLSTDPTQRWQPNWRLRLKRWLRRLVTRLGCNLGKSQPLFGLQLVML